jgi:hypothetical protein
MEAWQGRVVEEANLFNPAFCAVLLAKTAEEFTKKANQPLPFSLRARKIPRGCNRHQRE